MKPRLTALILIAAALCPLLAAAQTTPEEMAADPATYGGVYYPYPVPADAASVTQTPAPKGYEPFYVSHFSRHGSRYLIADEDLDRVAQVFIDADSAGVLTPLGNEVKEVLVAFQPEMRGRGGELTPLGERQHRGIARRMHAAFPAAFAKGADITAVSTPVMRCAYSMMAFTEALKEKDPSLSIPRESSPRNLDYLNYHSPRSNHFTRHDGPTRIELAKFKAANTRPDRLVASLFTDSAYVWRNIDPAALMWGLYWVAADLPNTEQGTDLYHIFTPEELFALWEVFNWDFYVHNASYPLSDGLLLDNAQNLLNNILDTAEAYIADGRHGASLRFAHDGNIVPLVGLMRLQDCYGYETRPSELYRAWAMQKVAPMASNVQLIFFRNKKNPQDILVKVLFNEKETAIPELPQDLFPYYRWSDAGPYLRRLATTPSSTFMPRADK